MKYLSLEFFKMRRRGIFPVILFLLAAELGWALGFQSKAFYGLLPDPHQPMWEALLLYISMVKGLIFPILIAVSVSRVNDMEHNGNTWKLLESSAELPGTIWRVKFLSIYLLVSIAQVLELGVTIAFGALKGIAEPFPPLVYLAFFLGSMGINAAIILFQQWISMTVENQLVAMAVGMFGAFLGFFSMFLPTVVRYLLIWGYYANLSPATFSPDGVPARLAVSPAALLLPFAAAIVLYFVGRRQFMKTES